MRKNLKPRRAKREEMAPKRAKNFRLADDVITWLEAQTDQTEAVEAACRLLRDAQAAAGREWHFAEAHAKADGVSLGKVVGELVAAGLQARARKR